MRSISVSTFFGTELATCWISLFTHLWRCNVRICLHARKIILPFEMTTIYEGFTTNAFKNPLYKMLTFEDIIIALRDTQTSKRKSVQKYWTTRNMEYQQMNWKMALPEFWCSYACANIMQFWNNTFISVIKSHFCFPFFIGPGAGHSIFSTRNSSVNLIQCRIRNSI